MWKISNKLMIVFCCVVALTFLSRHGYLDTSGVDKVTEKTINAVTSDQGQEYIREIKSISEETASAAIKKGTEVVNSEAGRKITGDIVQILKSIPSRLTDIIRECTEQ